jgi:integrase
MLRTKSGLPKHCSWASDRHGKRRVRFRRGGVSAYLTATPWSEDFMRQYAAALEGVRSRSSTIGASRTLPDTINALAVSYYGSPDFRRLKASTAALRRNIIERFRSEHGDKPVARLERKHINDILGAKSKTPQAANNLLKVLRLLLNYAITIGMVARNPALGVKGYPTRGEGFHTWSEAEVAQFEATYPIGSKERLAFALTVFTGQRISDVVKMGWQHVKDGWIAVRQEKTDAALMIPVHPELMRILVALPRNNLTFLVTDRGATFTAAGFSNWFGKRCRNAGLVGTAHGLRKTAATRLANAGCSTDQIKAITGHRTTKEVERYTRAADQTRLAAAALQLQLRAEREQNPSQPETRLDKQG